MEECATGATGREEAGGNEKVLLSEIIQRLEKEDAGLCLTNLL